MSLITVNEQQSVWESSVVRSNLQPSLMTPNNVRGSDQRTTQTRNLNKSDWNWKSICSSHFAPWFEGFLLGSLLLGIVLTPIAIIWSRSTSTSTSTSTGNSSSQMSATTSASTAASTCWNWLWNSTGEIIAGTGSSGNGLNQLNSPWNLYFDSKSNSLYIADSSNHRILKWTIGSPSGILVAGVTGTSGSSSTLLNTPRDVFLDSSSNLYVADSMNNRIQLFPSGSSTGITVSSTWSSPGALWGVQLFQNSIYALDNGRSAFWINGTMFSGSSLTSPQGFAVDTIFAPGTVYVANSLQNSIVQWLSGSSSGTVVAGTSGTSGNSASLLHIPVALKVDSYSNLFVVDNNNHRIQLFCQYPVANQTGRTIAGTGSQGTSLQTLNYPAGLALDSSLNLYVADTSNNRIMKFQRLV